MEERNVSESNTPPTEPRDRLPRDDASVTPDDLIAAAGLPPQDWDDGPITRVTLAAANQALLEDDLRRAFGLPPKPPSRGL